MILDKKFERSFIKIQQKIQEDPSNEDFLDILKILNISKEFSSSFTEETPKSVIKNIEIFLDYVLDPNFQIMIYL